MTKTDIAWLAGILEGEGWFGLQSGRYPAIALRMSDEDVVRRSASLLGVRVNGPYATRGGYKPTWMCAANGEFAVEWMHKLYPLLGKRRRVQIDEALSAWSGYQQRRDKVLPQRAKRGARMPARCHPDRPITGMGLCRACYMKKYYPKRHYKA